MVDVSADIILHRKVTDFSIFLWISYFSYQFGYNKIKTGFFKVHIIYVTFLDVWIGEIPPFQHFTPLVFLKKV